MEHRAFQSEMMKPGSTERGRAEMDARLRSHARPWRSEVQTVLVGGEVAAMAHGIVRAISP